jgi:hypothetical protein
VDVSIPRTEELFDEVIDELKGKTVDFYHLGSYRAML